MTKSIYDIPLRFLDGSQWDWKFAVGKKLMIVNVASQCGYTNQYSGLQQLYDLYKDKLIIIGCPCNDFGAQEPGSETDIQEFCVINFGVEFPITEKLSILNDPHPLYQYLLNETKINNLGDELSWNFHKFLIDENGNVVKSLSSSTEPFDDIILDWINA